MCAPMHARQAWPSLATCQHMHMHGHHIWPLLATLPHLHPHVSPCHAPTYAWTHMAHTPPHGMNACTCTCPHDMLAHPHGHHPLLLLTTLPQSVPSCLAVPLSAPLHACAIPACPHLGPHTFPTPLAMCAHPHCFSA